MREVRSLDELEKPIGEYNSKSMPGLTKKEKETYSYILKESRGNGRFEFYSNMRAGIVWARKVVSEGLAEFKHAHVDEEYIYAIAIRGPISLMRYYVNEDRSDKISDAFDKTIIEEMESEDTHELSMRWGGDVEISSDEGDIPEDYKIRVYSKFDKENRKVEMEIIGQEELRFYSEEKTGVRWALERLEKGEAELNFIIYKEDKIYGIEIVTSPFFISAKTREYKNKSMSSIF